MKEIIEKLATEAKGNRKLLHDLKCAAVNSNLYEVAAKLREIEVKDFLESHTNSPEYKEAEEFHLILRMVGVNCTMREAYVVSQAAKGFLEKKGDFDVKDAAEIRAKALKIFVE